MLHYVQTLHISCTETNIVSKQIEARFRMTHVIYASIFFSKHLDTPDELLDDMCYRESHFGPFGDSVRFGARLVHGTPR